MIKSDNPSFFTNLRKVQNLDEIIGIDGVGVPVNDIVDMFSDSKMCPGLIGKVKVFIFQVRTDFLFTSLLSYIN